MNKQIRALYELAHGRKPVIVIDHVTGNAVQAGYDGKPMFRQEFSPEKFVALIVNECFTKLTPYLEDQFIDDIKSELLEHFGIES